MSAPPDSGPSGAAIPDAASPDSPAVFSPGLPGEALPDEPLAASEWRWRSMVELAVLAASAVGVTLIVRVFLIQAFYIPSGSMLPQLQLQDKVVVSRLAYRLHPVHRGDIIVFPAPPDPSDPGTPDTRNWWQHLWGDIGQKLGVSASGDMLIKRVIGLPGETVEGRLGHVYINNHLLLEPYLPAGLQTETFTPVKVPPGQLWVMGDNRPNSDDSHEFGTIPAHSVVGRAILRAWPISHMSFL
jgi:signal peptidase I